MIHVAGTKGKGSTCSYTESILRNTGEKTGFFSSPHLIEVRERIRIEGVPLSRENFSNYFWICYDLLRENNEQMPSYFQFLTLMAFYVFHKEKVTAAVIEVGLGGLYDCTNVIKNPVVCGITHLGIDHVSILGNTLESIAEHKAGIFKSGSIAVTVPQKPDAMNVLKQTARIENCRLYLTPLSYEVFEESDLFKNKEPFERENMSLAIQLSRIWMEIKVDKTFEGPGDSREIIPVLPPILEDDRVITGLTSNQWLGRVQIVKRNNITYYLDGAHNEDSIKVCSEWFKKRSAREIDEIKSSDNPKKVMKILMFNITGGRNSHDLLTHLMDCNFDWAVFTPNICYREGNIEDQSTAAVTVTVKDATDVCQKNKKNWEALPHNTNCESKTHVFERIYDSIFWCSQGKDKVSNKTPIMSSILNEADHVQILVTGSLYLVGGVLTIFRDINLQ